MTAKELAIKMLRPYIERGDSIESTKAGQMGTFGSEGFAQIGGYYNGKKYSNDHVIASVRGSNSVGVYKLKDIYDEVLNGQTRLI